MGLFDALFKRKEVDPNLPGYTQSPLISDILAGISDAALMSRGKNPTAQKELDDQSRDNYKLLQEKQAADRDIANTKFNQGAITNREGRESTKFGQEQDTYARGLKSSNALTKSILEQYPDLKLDDVEGKDALALAKLIEEQKTRRDIASANLENARNNRTDRQDAINDRFDAGKLEGLSKRIEKSGAPQIEDSLNIIDALMDGKSDIAGVGMIDSLKPDFLVSEEGKQIRRNVAGVANTILKSRSGAAVTDQEYARFLNEAMTGKLTSEASLKSGLQKMRQDLVNMKSSIAKGYDPKIVKKYQENEGELDLGSNKNIPPMSLVRKKTKDGRIALFDPSTKAFVKWE